MGNVVTVVEHVNNEHKANNNKQLEIRHLESLMLQYTKPILCLEYFQTNESCLPLSKVLTPYVLALCENLPYT